jgi:aspartyl-tRNA synthetase
MDRFGTDRPDTRFGMEMKDISDLAANSDFQVLKGVLQQGGIVKAINVPKGAGLFSRKALDELSQLVVQAGAKGLMNVKITPEGWQSSLDKFFKKEDKAAVNQRTGAAPGDLLLIAADKASIVNSCLGMLRLELAKRLNLLNKDHYALVWVTRFPLLEYNEEEARLESVHHPFTSPLEEDLPLLQHQPEKVRARAYDIVLNGSEIGGGSVRIHNPALQETLFKILGISQEEANLKFGFFLEALRYGAPPHAGIALGLDRWAAILTGSESIREVIAFPKTQTASCLMSDAPSRVDQKQLDELGLAVKETEES